MIEIVRNMPVVYFDSFLKSLLILVPHNLPDAPKSPFGWDAFIKKITGIKPGDVMNLVKATVMLAVSDLIMLVTEKLEPKLIRRETIASLLEHCYFYIRISSSKKISGEAEQKLFEQILRRFSIMIGDISVHDRSDILANIFSVLDSSKKATNEEIIMVLSVSRYISTRPKTEKEALQITHLIRELNSCFDRTKRNVVRMAIIQSLERLLQPLDYTSQTPIENFHIPLINEVVELHKKARKWSSTEELRGASLRLIVIILVNSKMEYFGSHIDNYLNSDLCAKAKVRPYAYDCLLQLLRGRFYLDTRIHARQQVNNTFKISEAYEYITRPFEDELQDVIVQRLKLIADLLLVRRKGPIGEQNLDVCAEIFVQMAVHNLQITIKLIAHLLDPRNTTGSTETLYVGLKALRTIVDPDSGFGIALGALNDPQIQPYLSKIAMDFSTNITQIMHLCEHNVGISVLGRTVQFSDISFFLDHENNFAEKGNSFYTRPDDDIFAMLFESVEDPLISEMEPSAIGTPGLRRESITSGMMSMGLEEELELLTAESLPRNNTLPVKKVVPVDVKATKELNEKVMKAIKGWYEACGVGVKDLEALAESSLLFDPTSSHAKKNFKSEQLLTIRLFKEVIRMVPHMPTPALIGGEYFIGAYLLHSSEDLVLEVSHSLQRIFVRYPELRLSIINGFLNFIKTTPFQDDIALCTILSHLNSLLNFWTQREGIEKTKGIPIEKDFVYRLSCKLDGCVMIMLGRPNTRIRKYCLQILTDFYTIQQSTIPHPEAAEQLPLHAIILRHDEEISKFSMYGFMERDLHGYALVPKVTSVLTILSVREVAQSDFTILFRYYLGEISRKFMTFGRQKAIKHAAKFSLMVAVPYMTSVATVDTDFVATYSSYLVLMMSLAGAPLTSDISVPMTPISTTDRLLFNHFKGFLMP
ncbi:hypothetical protein HK096_004430, partial [Nowakowskiella sp. JEL0078]